MWSACVFRAYPALVVWCHVRFIGIMTTPLTEIVLNPNPLCLFYLLSCSHGPAPLFILGFKLSPLLPPLLFYPASLSSVPPILSGFNAFTLFSPTLTCVALIFLLHCVYVSMKSLKSDWTLRVCRMSPLHVQSCERSYNILHGCQRCTHITIKYQLGIIRLTFCYTAENLQMALIYN